MKKMNGCIRLACVSISLRSLANFTVSQFRNLQINISCVWLCTVELHHKWRTRPNPQHICPWTNSTRMGAARLFEIPLEQYQVRS